MTAPSLWPFAISAGSVGACMRIVDSMLARKILFLTVDLLFLPFPTSQLRIFDLETREERTIQEASAITSLTLSSDGRQALINLGSKVWGALCSLSIPPAVLHIASP